MSNFDVLQTQNFAQRDRFKRISQRNVLPAAIKPATIAVENLYNTTVYDGAFSVNNGVLSTLTSRVHSTAFNNQRLGPAPFMITFYEGTTLSDANPGTNHIPFDVTTDKYRVFGPFAMPDYTVNGVRSVASDAFFATDGNGVAYKTSIHNNSGSSQNIVYILQARVLVSGGGGAV